jgi:erythromycin esterase
MRVTSFILLLTFVFFCSGQQKTYINLTSVKPYESFEELSALDHYFENVQVVGMGESTHGTHEFFTMRHRMFQYLVENHGFNTFFLEADYVVCKPINDYIKTGVGDAMELVRSIGLWPWMTQEMVDLVKWMHSYNQKNPDQMLTFLGVDMQKYQESLVAMRALLKRNGMEPPSNPEFDQLTTSEFFTLKKKSDYKKIIELSEQFRSVDVSPLQPDDQKHYRMLIRHFAQITAERLSKSNYRDLKMGENLLFFMENNPDTKGFFWAHNGHIANWYNEKKNNWVAGGIINNSLGDRYFSIGLEFYQGSFNVNYYDKAKTNEMGKVAYTFGEVEVGPAAEGSLAHSFVKHGCPLFVPMDSLDPDNHVYMSFIGATYIMSDDPKSIYRFNAQGKGAYDAVILIEESTPTQMLPKK